MKKLLMMLLMLFSVTVFAVAQDDKADDEKQGGGRLYALFVAYATKELNLSSDEAQKFWPVYNQYRGEIRKTRQDGKAGNKKEIEIEESLLNIRKRYDGEFGKVLSKEKANRVFQIEKKFAAQAQRELLERRQQQNNRRLRQIP